MGSGFWKSGIQRAKSGDKRMEDKFSPTFVKEKELVKVEGFDDYYISLYCIGSSYYANVYHEPNTEPIDIMRGIWLNGVKCPQFMLGDYETDNYDDNKEDDMYSFEFIDAVNITLQNIYPESTWTIEGIKKFKKK